MYGVLNMTFCAAGYDFDGFLVYQSGKTALNHWALNFIAPVSETNMKQ